MWYLMLVCDLPVPVIMLFAGLFMSKCPPKDINFAIGYRTARSMKNDDTWRFAHAKCGRLWQIVGGALLPVSAAALVPLWGLSEDAVVTSGMIIMFVQLAAMLATIPFVEHALKKEFDENGARRNA